MTLDDYNAFRLANRLAPLAPMDEPKRPRGLNMTDKGWEGLRDLAAKLGYAHHNGGNISGLLEALGHGLWTLYPNTDAAKDA